MKLLTAQVKPIEVQLTPLIDMVFILLVFIVLVASFVRPRGIEVTPPAASTAQLTDAQAAVLSISSDGAIRSGDVEVADIELLPTLQALKADHPSLLIRADGAVALDRAIRVLDLARMAGFEAISMATRQQGEGL